MCIYWVHKDVTWSRKYFSFASTFDIRQICFIALNLLSNMQQQQEWQRMNIIFTFFAKVPYFWISNVPKCWNETCLALKYFCTALWTPALQLARISNRIWISSSHHIVTTQPNHLVTIKNYHNSSPIDIKFDYFVYYVNCLCCKRLHQVWISSWVWTSCALYW